MAVTTLLNTAAGKATSPALLGVILGAVTVGPTSPAVITIPICIVVAYIAVGIGEGLREALREGIKRVVAAELKKLTGVASVGGHKVKVNLHPSLEPETLESGQEFVRNKGPKVLEAAGHEVQGEVVILEEHLDAERALVAYRAAEENISIIAEPVSAPDAPRPATTSCSTPRAATSGARAWRRRKALRKSRA